MTYFYDLLALFDCGTLLPLPTQNGNSQPSVRGEYNIYIAKVVLSYIDMTKFFIK